MDKPENPAAFPISIPELSVYHTDGMSLRDWFAGQAIIGIAAYWADGPAPPEVFAKAAYGLADAMLAERLKP